MKKSGLITLGVVTLGLTINAKCNNAKRNKLTFFKDKMKSRKKKYVQYNVTVLRIRIWKDGEFGKGLQFVKDAKTT